MNEQQKIAYFKGFDAAWDHRMAGKDKPDNPYSASGQGELWRAWQDGYDFCFESGKRRLTEEW